MSEDFLQRLRARRNELSKPGGELTDGDFESPLPNQVISDGKATLNAIASGKSPDQKSFDQRLSERRSQLQGDGAAGKVIATTSDGGRVLEAEDGSQTFVSPGYSTSDPDQVAKILEGAAPADVSRSGFNQDIIDENPIAARATKFVEGTPFVGSYLDEAVGAVAGEDAAQAVRATSQAMDEENPNESLALNLGGAVTGGAALAAAALPSAAAAAPAGPLMRGAYAAGTGAVAGATEGAIYGAGRAEDGGRADNAMEGAAWGGGLGAGFGFAGSALAGGTKAMMRRFRTVDTKVIQEQFGVSKKAATAIKQALVAEDLSRARQVIAEMGDEAMLADAGPATGAMLDAAAQTGGAALRTTREAVEGRLERMSPRLTTMLDGVLGKPTGVRAASKAISQRTAKAREGAYKTAFSRPINYASDKGRKIEEVLSRVPPATLQQAISEANEAMIAEGLENLQLFAEIAEDGAVDFREMPNTQQLHQIKVALQTVARGETDAITGRVSAKGVRANKLSAQLRDALNAANPSYKVATSLGGDKIAEENALDLGRRLLRGQTTPEMVEDFLEDAPQPAKDAMRQGIRQHIEQTLGNVRRTITDPNVDIRQTMAAVKELSSDNAREKLTMALGEKPANRLFKELDQQATALELRSMVSRNSATAARQAIQGQVEDLSQPGAVRSLGRGEPVNAGKKVIQALTGVTDDNISEAQKGLFDEIAASLTQVRGAEAERALTLVEQAMSGQPLKDAEAQFVARIVGAPLAISGDAYGREQLAR